MKTLIPAYGRDYKTGTKALADWQAGKDFIIADMFDPFDGKPVNLSGAKQAGWKSVLLRFDGMRKIKAVQL